MKSANQWEMQSGTRWRFKARACLVLLLTGALFACGGSGGGNDDPVGPVNPTPTNPTDTFTVSGTINGLIGPVQLGDGYQILDIASDGAFAFTHGYKKGDTFAITVDTGTTDQLCTLTHGSGLVLESIDDVSIDCLELRETNIRVIKPAIHTAFNQLNLRSSYQAIPQLAGETSTLVVAKNQFVSVSTSVTPSKAVYLAFVKSFDETVVDSLSTAVSLVLLNPSIHGAIEEREARFEFFATRFADLPAVDALKDAIQTKADAGQLNLLTLSADLLPLLDSAVTEAAENITDSGITVVKPTVSRTEPSRKLVVTPVNGTQQGIALTLTKIAPDSAGNNYQLQVDNAQQRFVAVESLLLPSPVAMAPGGSQLLLLQSSNSDGVEVTVSGPGATPATAPVSASLKQAVIDTAAQFYALPSLAFTTGRLQAFDWRLLVCVDAAALQQIRDAANTELQSSTVLSDALQTPNYTAAYDAVTQPLRVSIKDRLAELMQCDFFRKGHWLEEHADTAEAQIGLILDIARIYYAPRAGSANVLITQGLYSAGGVITASLTEQQWQLSNKLKIELARTRNGVTSAVTGAETVNEGEALVLDASCTNPADSSSVPCNVQWTSPQGTTTANTLNEVLAASGTIGVSATDEDGAMAAVTIVVTVIPRPIDENLGHWTEHDGASSRRVDIVSVNFIPADVNNPANHGVALVRGFSGSTNSDPIIQLSLPQFAGAGTYVLDDLEPGSECLGSVATAQPPEGESQAWDQWWCTKTLGPFVDASATGSALYSIDSQGRRSVDFEFEVVPVACQIPSSCARRQITGHIDIPN